MATKVSARDFTSVKKIIERKRLQKMTTWSSSASEEAKRRAEIVIQRLKADNGEHTCLGVLGAVLLLEKCVLEVTSYRLNPYGGVEVEIGELKNVLSAGGATQDEIKDLVWFRLFDFQDPDSREYFAKYVSEHESEKQIKKAERIGLFVYDFNPLPKDEKYSAPAFAPRVQLIRVDAVAAASALSPPSPPVVPAAAVVPEPVKKEKKEKKTKEVLESMVAAVAPELAATPSKKRKAASAPEGDAGEKPAKVSRKKLSVPPSANHLSDNPIIHGDGKEEAPIEDAIL